MEMGSRPRTHPGRLLQVVPTQRVVEVEADHVAVGEAEIVAHGEIGPAVHRLEHGSTAAHTPPLRQRH